MTDPNPNRICNYCDKGEQPGKVLRWYPDEGVWRHTVCTNMIKHGEAYR